VRFEGGVARRACSAALRIDRAIQRITGGFPGAFGAPVGQIDCVAESRAQFLLAVALAGAGCVRVSPASGLP